MLKKNKIWIIFIIILAIVLRLPMFFTFLPQGVQSKILWYDESFSLWAVDLSFGDLFLVNGADVHPPFYYVLLKMWMLGSSSVVWGAILSLIFSLLVIYYLYKLALEMFNEKVALVTSLLGAVMPLLIFQSTEIRMYSLLFFLATVSLWLYWKILSQNFERKYLISFGVVTLLGLITHVTFYFLVLVQGLYWFYLMIKYKKIAWFLCYILGGAFLLSLPAIIFSVRMNDYFSGMADLIIYNQFNIVDAWGVLIGSIVYLESVIFANFKIGGWLFFGVLLFIIYNLIIFVRNKKVDREIKRFIFGFLVVFFWCIIIFKLALFAKYAIIILIPVMLIFAVNIVNLDNKKKVIWGLLFGVFLGFSWFNVFAVQAGEINLYHSKEFAKIINENYQEGDVVLAAPATFYPYFQGKTVWCVPAVFGQQNLVNEVRSMGYVDIYKKRDYDRFNECLNGAQRVWLFQSELNSYYDRSGEMIQWLERNYYLKKNWYFPVSNKNDRAVLNLFRILP